MERCGETLQRTSTPDTATTTHEEPSCSRCTATCTATLDRRLVASDLPCRSQTQRAACRCLSLPVRLLQRMTTPTRCGALRGDAATNDHSGECDDRDGFLLKHARGAILRPLHWPPAPPRWTAAWWRQTCRAGPRHSAPPAAACRFQSDHCNERPLLTLRRPRRLPAETRTRSHPAAAAQPPAPPRWTTAILRPLTVTACQSQKN